MSLGAVLFITAIFVGMSVPANLFITQASPVAAVVAATHGASALQTLDVSADAAAIATPRDGFSVTTYASMWRAQNGDHTYSFVPTVGAVRWPFPFSVPISDGWGPRVAPCSGCSTFHRGLDFTPGTGSPIYAMADGVVSIHEDANYGFGNYVVIHHSIDGQNVDSLYAHMLNGSSALKVGDTMKAGEFIGLVGDTGTSVGAHLHFEVHLDNVPVDPFEWLKDHACN